MSAGEDEDPGLDGDDALAAEYVLGVQPAGERAATAHRVEEEPAFAQLVEIWEERLSPLASAYAPAEAPRSAWSAIERRLFGDGAAVSGPGLWASIAFWRALTVGAFVALALAVAMPVVNRSGPRMLATLGAEGSNVRYVAIYDPAKGDIGLSHFSGARGDGKDFELWLIAGEEPPKSLGVVPPGETVHLRLSAKEKDRMALGESLAISLEPAGGSPTGSPTGPVVAAGELKTL